MLPLFLDPVLHVIFVFVISMIFVVVEFSLCLAVMVICFEPVLSNFSLFVLSLCLVVV